jgi:molybdopterin-guanine dinucleotide biosynthesis protein
MAIVVIGGHSRNIGKTSVVCAVIAALRQARWTAIKITQSERGEYLANGESCDTGTADHTMAISEELDTIPGTDSSRYLAAGAARSLWVRTRRGELAAAMPRIRAEMAYAENVIVESNSILEFLCPDVYASVLDPSVIDFKPTALRYLDRADAVLLPEGNLARTAWSGVSLESIAGKAQFSVAPPRYESAEFAEFVRSRIGLRV